MLFVLNAILPITILLIIGNILRRYMFHAEEFWQGVERLIYYILFPAMLIYKISNVNLSALPFLRMLIFLLILFAILVVISYGTFRLLGASANQFSSIVQSIARFNSYVFFALVAELLGAEALTIAAVATGLIVPITNIICITSFSYKDGQFKMMRIVCSVMKNPLFLACVIGFSLNILPIHLPNFIISTLNILGAAALPLALLAVGAAVRLKSLYKKHENFTPIDLLVCAFIRLYIVPAICLGLAMLMGFDSRLTMIFVLAFAAPTATSSYILAKQLGGDYEMMASHISIQTILSALSLTVWLSVLSVFFL